uniref:Secreted protein n=1 Tax=Brassica campestris TaxID=3711 RepID=M4DNW7_BRACM
MTSQLLLRTLPLLCNGFLSQCHQVNIAAVWFLSHRHRAEKPQLHKDNSPGESCATAAINSTPSIGDN